MRPNERYRIQIRDPIHGTLHVSRDELKLIDHAAYQRLRMIKQLGVADLAFPGATHTRYAHGLGTMHIASRMFRILASHYTLAPADEDRLLQTIRLATLFHDLGHAPLSHTTEAFMPPVSALGLADWIEGGTDRKANHEDYTLKIVVGSALTELVEAQFADAGVLPNDIATLIAGRFPTAGDPSRFVVDGRDWMPILRQCVSSELDADRMDYLLRDSYFAGVPYGRYDHEWLLENLLPVERNDSIYLGLNARASFCFEDYLLSRYHMFMSVYYHHIPKSYELMLQLYHDEQTGELVIPSDIEGYLDCDDVFLYSLLRRSKSEWAKRIVQRKAYRLLTEVKELVGGHASKKEAETDLQSVFQSLRTAGIRAEINILKGRLSKYVGTTASVPAASDTDLALYIMDEGRSIPVEEYTPLYRRYAGAIHLGRIYVDPAQLKAARGILERS